MHISYNWLKDYIDFDFSPEVLADKLTMTGIKVEEIIQNNTSGLERVIVGKVLSKSTHPNADKLSICEVDVGKERLNIVCGAPNVAEGQKVAVALIGSKLPNGIEIKESKIRGVVSQGMICAEDELGLGTDHTGIIVLPNDANIGESIISTLGLDDVTLVLELSPNRPDCLSIIGVARQISAITGSKIRFPDVSLKEEGDDIDSLADVKIENPDSCPRYSARVVQGVKIAESPIWMIRRLKAVGIRPINNVVDITNYVLTELGHPLHAFDYHRLSEKGKIREIVVRHAKTDEKFITLDGKEHILNTDDLLVTDGKQGVALAGVMGGLNSEITSDTNTVLIESAYFDPTVIRITSKRLGMHTSASHLFERGADYDMVTIALDRSAKLMNELAGGKIAKGVIDNYPKPFKKTVIPLRTQRVNKILGTDLKQDEISTILKKLMFDVTTESTGNERGDLKVSVPSFRSQDITREIDLIEEIACIYGYDNIKSKFSVSGGLTEKESLLTKLESKLKNILTSLGFTEVYNYSFMNPDVLPKLGISINNSDIIFVKNPLSIEERAMRTSLIPGIINTLSYNYHRNVESIRIFEIGKCFFASNNKCSSDKNSILPIEKLVITGAMMGKINPKSWYSKERDVDFYDIKGVVSDVMDNLKISTYSIAQSSNSTFHPKRQAEITVDKFHLGYLGELNSDISEEFLSGEKVVLFDLDLNAVLSCIKQGRTSYTQTPKFPPNKRDISFLVDESVNYATIVNLIKNTGGKILEKAVLFDIYVGEQVPKGKKSLTFSLIYRSDEKTLSDTEVDTVHNLIAEKLSKELSANVRGLS